MIIASLAGLLGSVISGFLGYRTGKRSASGSIETSDARTVWERSEKAFTIMKDLYEGRIKDLTDQIKVLRDEVGTLTTEVQALRAEKEQEKALVEEARIRQIEINKELMIEN